MTEYYRAHTPIREIGPGDVDWVRLETLAPLPPPPPFPALAPSTTCPLPSPTALPVSPPALYPSPLPPLYPCRLPVSRLPSLPLSLTLPNPNGEHPPQL